MSGALRLPLPAELNALLGQDDVIPVDGDNLGLWLDKYLRVDPGRDWDLAAADRAEELVRRGCRGSLGGPRTWTSATAATAAARARVGANALYGSAHRAVRARVNGRLLVDYGRASAHEMSLSMHHVLGCPRIPGSALKGLMRAWYRDEAECPGRDGPGALFGEPDTAARETSPMQSRGRLVFHDAYPQSGEFKLALDVLTPHVGEYYRDNAPPAEWLSPVPHTFVTVVETTFEFIVGLLPEAGVYRQEPTSQDDGEILDSVVKELAVALEVEGVGAKRAAGYGRMMEVGRAKS